MTLQEIINSLDDLSQEDITYLFEILRLKLSDVKTNNQEQIIDNDDTFWDMTLRFREQMEKEGIEFTDEDFVDLRDRSIGREINF
ncbi:hypothetical protein cce_0007 [Crocosphaera subtropica ATCC 51142]|uniref:Uncharacterized protein n=1 Tax=Crocosphaera subtropica (strain ATCC 51142 / BH68) TaxID=43989 RepID=B1WYC9_CROS5|nr:hypothetical protein [Crocosphaera subtropica]ACB49359.1 hypothetical protein cce_0007 [Crocosphaera subtropica ATCC 51142]